MSSAMAKLRRPPPPRRASSASSARSPSCASRSAPSAPIWAPKVNDARRFGQARLVGLTSGRRPFERDRMHPPVAQREAHAPGVPPVEPSTRFAARVAAGMFAGLAVLLVILAALTAGGGGGGGGRRA